jgi:hypothetical protein
MGTDRIQPANDDDARTGRGKRAADCLKIARGDEDTDAWLKLGGGWIAGYSAARWRKCGEINPTQPNTGGCFQFWVLAVALAPSIGRVSLRNNAGGGVSKSKGARALEERKERRGEEPSVTQLVA